MKFSRNWLESILGQTIDKSILLDKLTMAGLEVEACEPVAKPFTDVVVGRIERCEPHPDAKKLQVTYVNVGKGEELQIVCGAQNARAGINIAVAVCGAVLNNDFHIKEAKLRGVESFGMCCSESELGLAEASDGIIELPEDAPIGDSVRDYLNLDDDMITLGITPNRGDCLSLTGLARDTAAIFNIDYSPENIANIASQHDEQLSIKIENQTACPHYAGRVIRDIDINAKTPIWMSERLRRSGLRSIDPVVDVTNYVMLELGQPMHAFDFEKINDGIIVRNANEDEQLKLLNGDTVALNPKILMIADHDRPLAVAGVMGGDGSGVNTETKHIFLESAFFSPTEIAGRARWLGLHTDSSYRFERGVDPGLQITAIERATQLLLSIVGGKPGVVQSVPDNYQVKKTEINLSKHRLQSLIGVTFEDKTVTDLLKRLGIECLASNDTSWTFSVPASRPDLSICEDVMEEVARIYGYDQIPATIPELPLNTQTESETKISSNQHRQRLCNLGYQEVITYSFVDSQLQQRLEPNSTAVALTLQNPISADLNVMRTSLMTGLVNAALYNQHRQQTRGQLFEIAMCFQQSVDNKLAQTQHMAGIRWGSRLPQQWSTDAIQMDFFDLKGDVETVLQGKQFAFVPSTHSSFHPGQSADIILGDQKIGIIGQLHPKLHIELDVTDPLFYFELDLSAASHVNLPKFSPLSKFPSIRRDLALLIDQSIPAQALLDCVQQTAGNLLIDVTLFDVYIDEKLGSQKSIAVSLLWQDPTKTLIDDEINTLMESVLQSLNQQFNAVLRE